MRTLLLSLCLLYCLSICQAQTMNPLRGDTTYFHPNNRILGMTVDKYDNVYAGGNFTDTSGQYYVSKWNGKEWSTLGTGASALVPNGVIYALTTDTAGDVYAAGDITSGGRYRVMRWTGQQWNTLSDTLGTDTIVNGRIQSMVIDRYGYLYVAGYISDSIGRYCIARWDGSHWSKLQTTPTGPFNLFVNAVACDTFGNIYAAGAFKNPGLRNYVAKWNGSSWSEVDAAIPNGGFNNTIRTVAVDSRGNVYAGGDFTNIASQKYIRQWNGSSWAELDSGSSDLHSTKAIQSIVVDADDNIYAGGFSASVSRWDGTTCTKFPFAPSYILSSGAFTTLRANVAVDRHHNIYQGGMFADLGGEYLGAYIAPIPPQYLCLVTIDTSINRPVIVWEKADKYSTDSFIIYRAVTPDTFFTAVTSIHRDSLSEWVDQSALPDSMSYRYKIAVRDTAGIIDSLSPYHQTMCLRSLGQGQYAVTPYIIEGDTISAGSFYTLYRDSLGTDDWSVVGSLPASSVADTLLTVMDPFYMLFPNANYKVTLTLNYSCHASRAVSIVTSNILRHANSTVSVDGIKVSDIVLMTPNPVHDILTVTTTSSHVEKIAVINALGQVIYRSEVNSNIQNIDTRSWDAGIYFVSVYTSDGIYTKRIVRF